MSEWEDGYAAGWKAAFDTSRRVETLHSSAPAIKRENARMRAHLSSKPKRKASAYSIRYGKAFKRLAPKYKKKSGGWKKNGFRLCGAAARKVAKR